MTSFSEISCAQLFKRIGTFDAPKIINTRLAEDYARDTALIPSSRRVSHHSILNTLQEMPQDTPIGKTVVVCQEGHKVSHGAAAVLRAQGMPAEVLSGGFCAWREQGLPLVSLQALPEKHRQAGLWVTRHRPKIDRIACPWLLRRFIDPTRTFYLYHRQRFWQLPISLTLSPLISNRVRSPMKAHFAPLR